VGGAAPPLQLFPLYPVLQMQVPFGLHKPFTGAVQLFGQFTRIEQFKPVYPG